MVNLSSWIPSHTVLWAVNNDYSHYLEEEQSQDVNFHLSNFLNIMQYFYRALSPDFLAISLRSSLYLFN